MEPEPKFQALTPAPPSPVATGALVGLAPPKKVLSPQIEI